MKTSGMLATSVAIALLAGCGGGSSSPVAPTQAKQQPIAGSSSAKSQSVTVTFTIGKSRKGLAVRRASKTRQYISPGTEGAVVVATSDSSTTANDETYGYDLTDPNSGGSTGSTGPSDGSSARVRSTGVRGAIGASRTTDVLRADVSTSTCVDDSNNDGGRTCSLVFPLNADTYDIAVTTYDEAQTDSSASAPTGNPLSTQTKTGVTISSNATNSIAFLLGAYVEGFIAPGESTSNPLTYPALVGGVGGAGTQTLVAQPIAALDPDGYQIDQYLGVAPYANPYTVSITDSGDTTGCSSPCASVDPGSEATVASGSTTSTLASNADEIFTYTYTGGGGPGTGVKNATSESDSADVSAGTRPYYATVSVSPASSIPSGVTSSGITEYVLPLFAYAAQTTATSGNTLLVWIAQATPPGGAAYNNSSYTALFPSPAPSAAALKKTATAVASPNAPIMTGSTTCADGSGNQIMSIDGGTKYGGYGVAYTVTMAATSGSCTLTLSDNATVPDTTTLTLTNGTPGVTLVRPSPIASPLAPTGT